MGKFNAMRMRRQFLTDDEVDRLISIQKDPMIKALIAVLYLYGCRISEALALKRNSFWLDDEFLWVVMPTLKKKKTTKPVVAEPRKLNVSVSSHYIDYIIDYIRPLEKEQIMFPLTRQMAYYRICLPYGWKTKEQRERAYEDFNVWLHYFRDSCLIQLALNGALVLQLQHWAGWSTLQPAQSYLKLSGEMTKDLGNIRVKRGWAKGL